MTRARPTRPPGRVRSATCGKLLTAPALSLLLLAILVLTGSGELGEPIAAHLSGNTGALVPATGLVAGTGANAGPALITLTGISPLAPHPGDDLILLGTLRNLSGVILTAPAVQVKVDGQPRFGRSAVTVDDVAVVGGPDTLGDLPAGVEDTGTVVTGSRQTIAANLAPGELAQFRIVVPVERLALRQPGVYRLAVTGIAGVGVDEPRVRIGAARTVISWLSSQPVEPAPLLVLWPLTDIPHRSADGIFRNDDLAAELAPSGRLTRAVELGAQLGVTWVVDPALLVDVAAMRLGYRVVDPSAPSGVRTVNAAAVGARAAAAWLMLAKKRLLGGSVIVTGYGDPDLVAAQHGGRFSEALRAWSSGITASRNILGRGVRDDVIWPADNALDKATLAAATGLPTTGSATMVLDAAAAPPLDPAPFWTPSAHTQLNANGSAGNPGAGGKAVSALLLDEQLQPLLDGRAGVSGLAARQLAVAQTALQVLQLPERARVLAVALPRRADPTLAYALLAPLLGKRADDSAAVPWLSSTTLAGALASPAETIPRSQLRYANLPAAEHELGQNQVAATAAWAHDASGFASALVGHLSVPDNGPRIALEELSSSWRGIPATWQSAHDRNLALLASEESKIGVISRGPITMSSASGPIPITLRNDLTVPVRVRLSAATRPAIRLDVTVPGDISIDPERATSVTLYGTAPASGQVQMDLSVRSPDGTQIGRTTTLAVSVVAISHLAYGGLAVAVVLLVGLAAYRYRARREPPIDHPEHRDHPDNPANRVAIGTGNNPVSRAAPESRSTP